MPVILKKVFSSFDSVPARASETSNRAVTPRRRPRMPVCRRSATSALALPSALGVARQHRAVALEPGQAVARELARDVDVVDQHRERREAELGHPLHRHDAVGQSRPGAVHRAVSLAGDDAVAIEQRPGIVLAIGPAVELVAGGLAHRLVAGIARSLRSLPWLRPEHLHQRVMVRALVHRVAARPRSGRSGRTALL
jgi:hypothetical protein